MNGLCKCSLKSDWAYLCSETVIYETMPATYYEARLTLNPDFNEIVMAEFCLLYTSQWCLARNKVFQQRYVLNGYLFGFFDQSLRKVRSSAFEVLRNDYFVA